MSYNSYEYNHVLPREAPIYLMLYPDIFPEKITGDSQEKLARHFDSAEKPDLSDQQIKLASMMEMDERAANGLRYCLVYDRRTITETTPLRSGFGARFISALDNPQFAHHGHEHSRRVERWMERIFLRSDILSGNPDTARYVASAILFPYLHDMDQLLCLEKKSHIQEEKDKSFDARKGHTLASAIMLMAMSERYAYERKISSATASRICRNAAYMILRHDRSESGCLPSDNSVLAKMKIADLFTLLKAEKAAANVIYFTGSTYGLDKDFEEEYKTELDRIQGSNSPLVADDEDLRALDDVADVCVFADEMDMITPPIESMFRTYSGPNSLLRPFFPEISDADKSIFIQNIFSDSFNDKSAYYSDFGRKAWEMVHQAKSQEDDPYRMRVRREAVISGLAGLSIFSDRFTQGNAGEFIAGHYDRRKQQIIDKSRDRNKKISIPGIRQTVTEKLTEKIQHLDNEKNKLQQTIEGKMTSSPQKSYTGRYADNMIGDIIDKLYPDDPGAKESFIQARLDIMEGKYPGFIPFQTYDSFAGMGIVNTLVEPLIMVFLEDRRLST